MAVLGSPSLISLTVSVDVIKSTMKEEACKSFYFCFSLLPAQPLTVTIIISIVKEVSVLKKKTKTSVLDDIKTAGQVGSTDGETGVHCDTYVHSMLEQLGREGSLGFDLCTWQAPRQSDRYDHSGVVKRSCGCTASAKTVSVLSTER